MQLHIKKWGNSLGLRIPKTLALKVGLSDGTPIDLHVENGAIIIQPQKISLEALLNQVTPDNLHHEVATGKPTGREIL